MTRSRSAALVIAMFIAPLLASAQTDPALWRFVPPNAKALISIDWKRVRQSHIGTMIREKWVTANPAAASVPGIEFLDDVERFVISSPGQNPDKPSAEAPLLIVVRGHFDLTNVRKILSSHNAKPQMYNNMPVFRPQGKTSRDMAFVLLDPQTILIGDAHSVFGSLERSKFPAPAPDANSLLARATALDANYDVWAVMTTPGVLASDRLMDLFTGGELGAEARSFDIGFSLRNGLAADTAVTFQSELAAKRMASELSRLLKVAIKEKMGEPAMLDMEKKLKVTSDGALVKIAIHMTQQELDKNAQIFAATHKQLGLPVAELRPIVKPAPPPPPKTETKVIRIEGLDEGTREIPFKQP
jgi:hypothetical protein